MGKKRARRSITGHSVSSLKHSIEDLLGMCHDCQGYDISLLELYLEELREYGPYSVVDVGLIIRAAFGAGVEMGEVVKNEDD